MIFFGVFQPTLVIEKQRLATQEIPKKSKNAKKSSNNFPANPHFSA